MKQIILAFCIFAITNAMVAQNISSKSTPKIIIEDKSNAFLGNYYSTTIIDTRKIDLDRGNARVLRIDEYSNAKDGIFYQLTVDFRNISYESGADYIYTYSYNCKLKNNTIYPVNYDEIDSIKISTDTINIINPKTLNPLDIDSIIIRKDTKLTAYYNSKLGIPKQELFLMGQYGWKENDFYKRQNKIYPAKTDSWADKSKSHYVFEILKGTWYQGQLDTLGNLKGFGMTPHTLTFEKDSVIMQEQGGCLPTNLWKGTYYLYCDEIYITYTTKISPYGNEEKVDVTERYQIVDITSKGIVFRKAGLCEGESQEFFKVK